jgi:hypothetical protein
MRQGFNWRAARVFISFGEPQAHDDRLPACGRLSIDRLILSEILNSSG